MADVTANGIRLNYMRLGSGNETVVFIHGLIADNLASFYFCAGPGVARHADVILYDLRGHGRSERPPDGYSLQDHIADLYELLDELGLDKPVHLVGNSFGGAIALNFALQHPDRVAGLILIDAYYAVEGWSEKVTGILDLAAVGLSDQGVLDWLEFEQGRRLRGFTKTADALVNRTTLIQDLGEVEPVRPEDLAAIQHPVMALYGENSELIDLGRELESLTPLCRLHVIPDVGHFVLIQASKTVEYHVLTQLGVQVAKPEPRVIKPLDLYQRIGLRPDTM